MVLFTKICTGCSVQKEADQYHKKSSGKGGLDARCKSCIKERDRKARDKINSRLRFRYKNDPDYRKQVLNKSQTYREKDDRKKVANARSKVWRRENPEKTKRNNTKYSRKHYEENKEKYILRDLVRNTRVRKATPTWASTEDIERVYLLCRKVTKLTGIPHEVDHILPIKGNTVCGLHTFSNLRIITRKSNRSKSNKILSPDVFEPGRDWEYEWDTNSADGLKVD